MKGDIYERTLDEAVFIIENNATVRTTAKKFGISKSTVHKDVVERLIQVNPVLHNEVRKVLDSNLDDRARRGGQATMAIYRDKRNMRENIRRRSA